MFVVDGHGDSQIKNMIVSSGDDLTERKKLLRDNGMIYRYDLIFYINNISLPFETIFSCCILFPIKA